jgi:hypothetical protein
MVFKGISRRASLGFLGVVCSLAISGFYETYNSSVWWSNMKGEGTQKVSVTELLAYENNSAASFGECNNLPANKPKVFDPFVDIHFTALASASEPSYSSVHCVGTGRSGADMQSDAESYKGRRPNFVSRTCHYKNLYYRPADQTFFYHVSPTERMVLNLSVTAETSTASDLLTRSEVSLGHTLEFLGAEKLARVGITPWTPQSFHEDDNSWWNGTLGSVATVDPELGSVFLLYQSFHAMNIGHLVWDDLLSLFSMLDLFDMQDDLKLQAIPLLVELKGEDKLWRCTPSNWRKYELCVKAYRKFYPTLFGIATDCSGDILRTGNWLQGEAKIGTWHNHPKEACPSSTDVGRGDNFQASYVLLPQVLVGTGRLNNFGCEDDCGIGRGPQFYRFRNFMMRNLFGSLESCLKNKQQPAGYITFSLSVNSSRPEQIYHFVKEIELARAIYGDDKVKAVNMASLSMQGQADLVRNSAVLLSNHGGVSASSVFLSRGSSVLLYWHGDKRYDHSFFESAGYFRTTWIGENERSYVNRTMALIAKEMELFSFEWLSKAPEA